MKAICKWPDGDEREVVVNKIYNGNAQVSDRTTGYIQEVPTLWLTPVEVTTLDLISQTRHYLDYLERHINNVNHAFEVIQKKCRNLPIISDGFAFEELKAEVLKHDWTKLGKEEFYEYRRHSFPVLGEASPEDNMMFGEAWGHHKKHNPHHWENWTENPGHQTRDCTHMVIDWLAMSYEFGDSPREYYEKNASRIDLPEWAVEYIYEIFELIEPLEL